MTSRVSTSNSQNFFIIDFYCNSITSKIAIFAGGVIPLIARSPAGMIIGSTLVIFGAIGHIKTNQKALENSLEKKLLAQGELEERIANGKCESFLNSNHVFNTKDKLFHIVPLETDLLQLSYIFYEKMDQLTDLLHVNQRSENPWENQKIFPLIEECMHLGYLIGCKTLDELDDFVKNYKLNKGKEITKEEALTMQTSYQYRTFFFLPQIYHIARSGTYYLTERNMMLQGSYHFFRNPQSLESKQFYQEGTLQFRLHSLYCLYHFKVKEKVSLEALEKKDSRFTLWIDLDLNPNRYLHPGTLPT